jgi:hypothetical protein
MYKLLVAHSIIKRFFFPHVCLVFFGKQQYVAQPGLEFIILLPQFSLLWDYSCVLQHVATYRSSNNIDNSVWFCSVFV